MTSQGINPFAFRSPNGSTSLINTWLLGKTLELRFLNEPTTFYFSQLIVLMGGLIQFDENVDYIVSGTFMRPSDPRPIVVRPEWIVHISQQTLIPGGPSGDNVLYSREREQFKQLEIERVLNKRFKEVDTRIYLHNRARIVAAQQALMTGDRTRDVAAKLHMSLRDVMAAKKAMENPEPPPEHRRPGRPSKATPDIINEIHATTTENPYLGARALARTIFVEKGVSISRQTVNTYRKWMHFRFSKGRKCPLMTPRQVEKRLAFSVDARQGTIDWTREVIITDESRFGLYDDSRSMWVQRGVYTERTFRPTPKHNSSIMVWGAIGWNYKSKLIIVEGTLNAVRYQEMLKVNKVIQGIKQQFRRRTVYFQQDGAPAHRAKSTMKWLTRLIQVILNWPPNSPDLSVIENVWGILKRRVAERRPQNIAELTRYLLEEWDNLDQKIINDLIESMNQRFDWCIEEQGKSIGHLVRNHAHAAEPEADTVPNCAPPPPGLLAVRQVKAKHVGTSVIITAHVTEIRPDKVDPNLIWVELEDHVRHSKRGRCRKIGMMAHADETQLFPSYSELLFVVEVQAAYPEFIGNPETPKTATKLKIYLKFLAIHDAGDGEEDEDSIPPPPEFDDEEEEEDNDDDTPETP
jgi:transposase